ncbi:MAG: YaeQ family protein [Halieaceae bacterium]
MALKSTICKARINIADMDREVYGDFNLTIAQHPSETDERMMLRLLAFALNADEQLEFGRGISTDDEPDLWRKSLTGDIELWIELGTPDPERLRKACGRADAVVLYCYGDRATPVWWDKHGSALQRFDKLSVYQVEDECAAALAAMADTGMDLQCTIESGEAWFNDASNSVHVAARSLKN